MTYLLNDLMAAYHARELRAEAAQARLAAQAKQAAQLRSTPSAAPRISARRLLRRWVSMQPAHSEP